MRLALLPVVLAGLIACEMPASAQTYSSTRPIPATTSIPTLHAQAVARAVHERFRIGLAALDASDWGRAATQFEAVVALHPTEPKGSTAWYDLAIAQANLGQNDAAAASLNAALALDHAFLAAMANLIAIDLRRGDVRDAREVADRFVALAPDSARALYSRGLIALRMDNFAVARSDFAKLLSNDPSYAVAHYDLGVTEARIGAFGTAQHEFASALALAPRYARARFALGTILLREGHRAEALAAFERAARDSSDDPTLHGLAIAMRDAIATSH